MNSDWTHLAYLALLVERGKAQLETAFDITDTALIQLFVPPAKALHKILVSTTEDFDASKLEPAELAEAMASAWMERASALGAGRGGVGPGPCPSTKRCVACSAEVGQWCRAVHAGERDAGGWAHPGRDATVDRMDHVATMARDLLYDPPPTISFPSGEVYFPADRVRGFALAVLERLGQPREDPGAWRRLYNMDPSPATGRDLDRLARLSMAHEDVEVLGSGAAMPDEIARSRFDVQEDD